MNILPKKKGSVLFPITAGGSIFIKDCRIIIGEEEWKRSNLSIVTSVISIKGKKDFTISKAKNSKNKPI